MADHQIRSLIVESEDQDNKPIEYADQNRSHEARPRSLPPNANTTDPQATGMDRLRGKGESHGSELFGSNLPLEDCPQDGQDMAIEGVSSRPTRTQRKALEQSILVDDSGNYEYKFSPLSGLRQPIQIGLSNKIPDSTLPLGLMAQTSLLEAAGDAERCLQEFRQRDDPQTFYKAGKVFRTLWVEEAREASDMDVSMNAIRAGDTEDSVRRHTGVRDWVVLRAAETYCIAVPIIIRGEQGVSRSALDETKLRIVYTGKDPPASFPEEHAQPRDLPMQPKAIRVVPDNPMHTLHVTSRIDYGRIFTIEHSIKAQSFGRVHSKSMAALKEQYRAVCLETMPKGIAATSLVGDTEYEPSLKEVAGEGQPQLLDPSTNLGQELFETPRALSRKLTSMYDRNAQLSPLRNFQTYSAQSKSVHGRDITDSRYADTDGDSESFKPSSDGVERELNTLISAEATVLKPSDESASNLSRVDDPYPAYLHPSDSIALSAAPLQLSSPAQMSELKTDLSIGEAGFLKHNAPASLDIELTGYRHQDARPPLMQGKDRTLDPAVDQRQLDGLPPGEAKAREWAKNLQRLQKKIDGVLQKRTQWCYQAKKLETSRQHLQESLTPLVAIIHEQQLSEKSSRRSKLSVKSKSPRKSGGSASESNRAPSSVAKPSFKSESAAKFNPLRNALSTSHNAVNIPGPGRQVLQLYDQYIIDCEKTKALMEATEGIFTDLNDQDFRLGNLLAKIMTMQLADIIGELREGMFNEPLSVDNTTSPAASEHDELPHVVAEYFSRAGDINVQKERLQELEFTYLEDQADREFLDRGEHGVDSETEAHEFEERYREQRHQILHDLNEAVEAAAELKERCRSKGLDPEDYRNAAASLNARSINEVGGPHLRWDNPVNEPFDVQNWLDTLNVSEDASDTSASNKAVSRATG